MEVRPGYKQSEVGVIPNDWDTSSLLAVADCLDNVRVPLNEGQRQRMQGDIPYCGANGVLDYVNDFVIDDDIVLMAEDGGYFDQYASRPIAYRMKGKCWVNNHAHILKAKSGHDQGFLYYALVHKNILPFLASGTRAKLNKSEMEKIIVPAPPTEAEQRAIAAALSDVDALLGGLDRLIAKKRDLKQAAMQQLLTGQTRLPGFHGEWEPLNMTKTSTLKARIGWQGLTTAEYLPTGNYYLVTGTDFAHGRVQWSTCCFVSGERYAQDRHIQLIPRDILLTKDGTIGKVGFVDSLPGPATLNSGVFVIRPKAGAYDPQFFYYVLTSHIFDDFLRRLKAGSTISHLYQKDFVSFSFLAPAKVPEQTAIAAVLSDMDAELAALEARRDKTRDLKQAMMQELLTGKTRLVSTGGAHA